jgi:hypothetical protein
MRVVWCYRESKGWGEGEEGKKEKLFVGRNAKKWSLAKVPLTREEGAKSRQCVRATDMARSRGTSK